MTVASTLDDTVRGAFDNRLHRLRSLLADQPLDLCHDLAAHRAGPDTRPATPMAITRIGASANRV